MGPEVVEICNIVRPSLSLHSEVSHRKVDKHFYLGTSDIVFVIIWQHYFNVCGRREDWNYIFGQS
jgi:hypothetical protein